MPFKVAINGFGRIGRCVLRALAKSGCDDIEIVAINDLTPVELSAHLLNWDTTHGRFPGKVEAGDKALIVDGRQIPYSSERNLEELPWKQLGAQLVMECTGVFASRDKAAGHLNAGADRVLISAPASGADATIVYGVNHDSLTGEHKVVSNASCTTNCLAPVVKALHDALGIETGLMSTVHAYTNDQSTLDAPHKDYRRARAAAESIIPTKTGAAAAIGLVIPQLAGKLTGLALRVPVRNVSLVDFCFVPSRATDRDEVNKILGEAAAGELKGILEFSSLPLVSSDFNGNSASSIVDADQSLVTEGGRLVKVISWYDNEWGFSMRMLDTAAALLKT